MPDGKTPGAWDALRSQTADVLKRVADRLSPQGARQEGGNPVDGFTIPSDQLHITVAPDGEIIFTRKNAGMLRIAPRVDQNLLFDVATSLPPPTRKDGFSIWKIPAADGQYIYLSVPEGTDLQALIDAARPKSSHPQALDVRNLTEDARQRLANAPVASPLPSDGDNRESGDAITKAADAAPNHQVSYAVSAAKQLDPSMVPGAESGAGSRNTAEREAPTIPMKIDVTALIREYGNAKNARDAVVSMWPTGYPKVYWPNGAPADSQPILVPMNQASGKPEVNQFMLALSQREPIPLSEDENGVRTLRDRGIFVPDFDRNDGHELTPQEQVATVKARLCLVPA